MAITGGKHCLDHASSWWRICTVNLGIPIRPSSLWNTSRTFRNPESGVMRSVPRLP